MNLSSQPLVSIVTPVYNEEEHLAECIESILAQTYQNWDYTIVNNCSTDGSLQIARRYAAKDRRIRIHDNHQFLEMSANLNLAVRQISPISKYCKVVFGDDWIFPRCLEQMVAVGEVYPSVGVISAYEQCGSQIRITGLPSEQSLVSGRTACSQFLLGTLPLFGSQNSVLYRADFVRNRNPFYDESNMYADFEACFAILRTSDLGFVHEVLTFSRPRPASIGSIAADVGASVGSLMDILFRYGKQCLSEQDFKTCIDRYLCQYYSFLGRRLWVERDREFWSYHKETLTRTGIGFSRVRLAKAAVAELCLSLLRPSATLSSIKRLRSKRKIRNRQVRNVVFRRSSVPYSAGSKR